MDADAWSQVMNAIDVRIRSAGSASKEYGGSGRSVVSRVRPTDAHFLHPRRQRGRFDAHQFVGVQSKHRYEQGLESLAA